MIPEQRVARMMAHLIAIGLVNAEDIEAAVDSAVGMELGQDVSKPEGCAPSPMRRAFVCEQASRLLRR